MTINEAIKDVFLKATGKASAVPTAKRNQILGLLNFYQRRWAREKDVDWASLYDPLFQLGNVTATDTYDLDTSSIRKLSDREGDCVRIVHADREGYTDYDILKHDQLQGKSYGVNKEAPTGTYVSRVGNTLVFNHKFTAEDAQFGGTIYIPCYTFPEDILEATDSQDVQVDDPDWLVVRVAAEYVRNDITRRSRYPELLTEANDIMDRMKDDQEGQIDEISTPWTPPSGVGNDNAWS